MQVVHVFVKSCYNEDLTTYLGNYRLDFDVQPKVGDFITTKNVGKSLDCYIKEVKLIPKHESSTDCDVILQCVQIGQKITY
jgi:hypothetical protein